MRELITTHPTHHGAQSEPAVEARSLADLQAALADAYPDEYVVLLGDRLIVHTHDKEEAYRQYNAVFKEIPGCMPLVIPPGALRKVAAAVVRGRALVGPTGERR